MRGQIAFALLFLCGSLGSRRALADPEPLIVRAHDLRECPVDDSFFAEVSARTDRARPALAGEEARTFTVTLLRSGGAVAGVLEVESVAGGPTMRREIPAASCHEVVSALATMVALAVDPPAGTLPRAPAPPPAPAPASPAPAPASASASTSTPAPAPAPASAGGWRWILGAQGEAWTGVASGSALGAGPFLEARASANRPLSPALRVALVALLSRARFADPVGADVTFYVARLEGCPVRVAFASLAFWLPCAGIDAGVLRSTGVGVPSVAQNTRVWAAVRASTRVAWSAPGGWDVEAAAGLLAPLDAYRFELGRGATRTPIELYAMPVLAGSLTAALGHGLP